MENYNPSAPNPETIRQVLAAQDENINHLRNLVSNITGENLSELRKTLSDQLRQLEDLERRMWAALFPSDAGAEPASHRMTMSYNTNLEQYY
jgi:septation ring formation regulator EzrA